MPDNKSGPMAIQDLELCGYTDLSELSPNEYGLNNCRIFRGIDSGFARSEDTFIYLLAGTTQADLNQLIKQLRASTFADPYVVVPNSLQSRSRVKGRLEPLLTSSSKFRIYDELMWGYIKGKFEFYVNTIIRDRLESYKEPNYINPILEEPLIAERSGAFGYTEREATRQLFSFFTNDTLEKANNITVITADASVGKTALAANITSALARAWEDTKVIPVFLPADDWRKLPKHGNLWEIIQGLGQEESQRFPIDDENIFERILQLGYIALIFDGFDELRDMTTSPAEHFESLGRIATETNARIVVTARTSFWDREVGNADEVPHNKLTLNPFTETEFRNYCRHRLHSEDEVRQATELRSNCIRALQQGSENFFNLPICAQMIANYVEHGRNLGTETPPLQQQGAVAVNDFFRRVLERERIRQRLTTETDTTYNAFGAIAIEQNNDDEEFDEELLGSAGIIETDLENFQDHAFLNFDHGRNSYRFKYEFIPQHLRALRFLNMLRDRLFDVSIPAEILERINLESDGSGHLSDRLARLVGENDLQLISETHRSPQCFEALKSLLFHIVSKKFALEQALNKPQRTERIFRCFGIQNGRQVGNLNIRGSVTGLSIRNLQIHNSRFTDFSLKDRDAQNLRFVDCRFEGTLDIEGAVFENCVGYNEAKLVISKNDRLLRFSNEEIISHLHTALNRFSTGSGYRDVLEDDWKTGRTKHIEDRFGILQILVEAEVVEKVHRTGGGSRYRYSLAKGENRDYVRRFLREGARDGVIDQIIQQMIQLNA